MGRVDNLQNPAKTDPSDVCIKIGRVLSYYLLEEIVVANILAAVSPNLDIGPITSAGTIPL
jgi:hypothetical protein